MTDEVNRTCPHCGGKNTGYFIGIEESVGFTTKYETANGFGLFVCSDINRHKCPNLQKPEDAMPRGTMTRAVTPDFEARLPGPPPLVRPAADYEGPRVPCVL